MVASVTATASSKKLDERGEPIRGDRQIDEAQANVARRILREFASGISPRMIARTLNAEGVAGRGV